MACSPLKATPIGLTMGFPKLSCVNCLRQLCVINQASFKPVFHYYKFVYGKKILLRFILITTTITSTTTFSYNNALVWGRSAVTVTVAVAGAKQASVKTKTFIKCMMQTSPICLAHPALA